MTPHNLRTSENNTATGGSYVNQFPSKSPAFDYQARFEYNKRSSSKIKATKTLNSSIENHSNKMAYKYKFTESSPNIRTAFQNAQQNLKEMNDIQKENSEREKNIVK